MRDIHISVVSHNQWHMVQALLNDLDALQSVERIQVTLTHNVQSNQTHEIEQYSFPVNNIENQQPKGFGENHNAAFMAPPDESAREFFVVINPDVRIQEDVFTPLAEQLNRQTSIGVMAPLVRNNDFEIEDSIRVVPSPWIIFKKLFNIREQHPVTNLEKSFSPQWIAGMFMFFPESVFKKIGGFDERFFLYYEDVNICSRLWLEGFQVMVNPALSIIHNAQRDSHKSFRYLKWHLGSMLRFFLSDVYRQVKKFHKKRSA
jgi:GT2 family glycosyltransferase